VLRGQRNGSLRSLISISQTGAATLSSSSSSVVLTRLSGPRSRPAASQKIWKRWESNPGHLQPETLTIRPQRRSLSRLHGVISQRSELSIAIFVRSSNPANQMRSIILCCSLVGFVIFVGPFSGEEMFSCVRVFIH
jgi:hypothetical protein